MNGWRRWSALRENNVLVLPSLYQIKGGMSNDKGKSMRMVG